MRRHKEVGDAAVVRATGERRVLIGNDKGKSGSAFGMVARALGHGMHAGVVQFIKGSFGLPGNPAQGWRLGAALAVLRAQGVIP